MSWTIYCHMHIESGRRYIGQTKYSMMHRWHQHCAQAKKFEGRRSHFLCAIRKYGKDAFSHEVLEVCGTLEEANSAEERWIVFHGSRDPARGFNLAKGGQVPPASGAANPWDRPEFRAKQERHIKRFLDEFHTPEAYAARAKAARTPERRAASSAASKKAHARLDVRQNVIASGVAKRGKPLSAEHREKLRIKSMGRAKSEAEIAKLRAYVPSEETRAKLGTFKGKKHSEETKAKIAAAVRAKREARTAAEAERAIEYPIVEDS